MCGYPSRKRVPSLVQQPLCHLPATLSATLRGQAPLSALRHLSWEAIEATHQRSGEESGALLGMMRRAIAREERERAKAVDEQKRMTDRFASTLVIAASILPQCAWRGMTSAGRRQADFGRD